MRAFIFKDPKTDEVISVEYNETEAKELYQHAPDPVLVTVVNDGVLVDTWPAKSAPRYTKDGAITMH